jgi:hypothetical protein
VGLIIGRMNATKASKVRNWMIATGREMEWRAADARLVLSGFPAGQRDIVAAKEFEKEHDIAVASGSSPAPTPGPGSGPDSAVAAVAPVGAGRRVHVENLGNGDQVDVTALYDSIVAAEKEAYRDGETGAGLVGVGHGDGRGGRDIESPRDAEHGLRQRSWDGSVEIPEGEAAQHVEGRSRGRGAGRRAARDGAGGSGGRPRAAKAPAKSRVEPAEPPSSSLEDADFEAEDGEGDEWNDDSDEEVEVVEDTRPRVIDRAPVSARTAFQWVFDNVGDDSLESDDAPSEGAWQLLCAIRSDKNLKRDFYKQYAQKMMSLKDADRNERIRDDDREQIRIIDDLIRLRERAVLQTSAQGNAEQSALAS